MTQPTVSKHSRK